MSIFYWFVFIVLYIVVVLGLYFSNVMLMRKIYKYDGKRVDTKFSAIILCMSIVPIINVLITISLFLILFYVYSVKISNEIYDDK